MSFYELKDDDFEVCGDLTRLVVVSETSEFGDIKRKASSEAPDPEAELTNDHPLAEQFVYMLEGSARIRIGDDTHIVDAGQAVFIPKNTPHSIAAETDMRYVTFYAPSRASSIKDAANGRFAVYDAMSGA